MAKFKTKDKVILKANVEENWLEECGVIITVEDQNKYPGMFLVAVDPQNEYDDGIREIHEDAMVLQKEDEKWNQSK